MALVLADRVRDTTTTTGTGTITLSGTAPTGYQNFSVVGNGNTTYYTINAASQWEVGIGTYSSTGPTLSRDTVLASSNGGALVNFSSGTKDVFITYPAEKSVNQNGSVISAGSAVLGVTNGGTGATSLTSGYLLKGNGTSAVSASVIYDNGTNAGIGTSSPSYKLDISGNTPYTLRLQNTDATSFSNIELWDNTGARGQIWAGGASYASFGGAGSLNYSANSGPHVFYTNYTERARIDSSGNLLVGGTTAFGKISLQGDTNSNLDVWVRNDNAGSSSRAGLVLNASGNSWRMGMGSTANNSNALTWNVDIGGANTEYMRLTTGGNFAVGSTTTTARLTSQINSGNYLLDLINGSETGFALRTYNHGSASAPGLVFTQGIYYGTTENAAVKFYRGGGATGGYLGFTVTDGTERLSINSSGNVTASVDFRAPIFYDSNNTAYYLDPAGSSVLGTITAQSTNDAQLYLNSNGTTWAGISWSDVGGTDYMFYYGGTSTFAIGGGGSAVASKKLHVNGGTTIGSGLAGTSVSANGLLVETRVDAPIFYDSNNTAYYVDPAGTSNINGLNIAGTISITGTYGRAAAATGYLNGGYSGAETSSTTGPIYCISTGYAPTSTSLSSMFGIGYTDGTSSGIRSGAGWGMYVAANGSAPIFLDGSNGIAFVNGSVRSPIYYDSNNTAYYLDAASTSLLGGALFNNVTIDPSSIGAGVGVGTITESSTGFSAPGIAFGGGTGQHGAIVYAGDTMYFGAENGSDNTLGVRATLNNSGSFAATGDVRAPIFYDSNDTGYYLDPAGTSRMSTATINTIYTDTVNSSVVGDPLELCYYRGNEVRVGPGGGNLPIVAGTYARYAAGTGYLDGRYSGAENGGTTGPIYCINSSSYAPTASSLGTMYGIGYTIGSLSGVYPSDSGWGLYVAAGGVARVFLSGDNGTVWANSSVRAPIFYDSNNTAYYVDPSSTSGSANFAGNLLFPDTSNTGIRNATGDAFLWLDDVYGNLFIKNTNGGFYGDFTGYHFRSASSVYWAYLYASYFQHETSVRSPIFYDSNNTGYYVDPANTSYINTIQGSQYSVGLTNPFDAVNGSPWYGLGQAAVAGHSGASYIPQLAGYYGLRLRSQLYTLDVQCSTGVPFLFSDYGQFGGSVRAPIFYDSNDTGYYVDPATATNLAGTITQTGPGRTSIVGPNNYDTRLGSSDLWFWFKSIAGNGSSGYPGAIQFGRNDNVFSWPIVLNPRGGNVGVNSYSADYTLHVAGTGYASSDFRAPIFYDSNDTGYYADPNGMSVFYSLNTYYIYNKQTGNRVMYLDGSTYNQFADPTGTVKLWLGSGGDPSNYYNASTHYFRDNSSTNVALINSGGIQAPLYYDLNNTSYYVDPASGSVLGGNISILGGRNITLSTSSGSVQIKGDAGGWSNGLLFYGSSSTYRGGFGALGSVDSLSYYWIGSDYNTAALYIYASGYAQASGSLRAPIFYDSNDTGYYVDPNATSNLVGLTVTNRITGYVTGCTFTDDSLNKDDITTRTDTGFYQSSSGTTAEGWPLNDGGWQHMLSCTHSNDGNYYAMQLGASFYSQGLFYRSTAGSGSTAWSRVALYGNNYNASLYASILYDSGDTSYYCDPNYISQFWRINASNYIYCTNEIYGSVFYDTNNTAYYLDAQTTGTSLNVAGSIVAAGNVTAYSDARVKTNVARIEGALDKVSKIGGYTYNRTDLADTDRVYGGVIAQEIEAVLPEAIFDQGDLKAVDYNATIALLIEAIKELKSEVNDLKAALQ